MISIVKGILYKDGKPLVFPRDSEYSPCAVLFGITQEGNLIPLKITNDGKIVVSNTFQGEIEIAEVVIKGILVNGQEVKLAAVQVDNQNILRVYPEPVQIKNSYNEIINPALEDGNLLLIKDNFLEFKNQIKNDIENIKTNFLSLKNTIEQYNEYFSKLNQIDVNLSTRGSENTLSQINLKVQELPISALQNLQNLSFDTLQNLKILINKRNFENIILYPNNQVILGPNRANQYIYPSNTIEAGKYSIKTFFFLPSVQNRIRFRIEAFLNNWVPITDNILLSEVNYYTRYTLTDAVNLIRVNAAPTDNGTYTLYAFFGGQS